MLNRKLILLFIIFCIIGFSMSPVNATTYEHFVNGVMGDVFIFDEWTSHGSDVNQERSDAFIKSGLFTYFESDSPDLYKTRWNFYATKTGFSVVKVDHWYWADPDYYYFDIEL